MTRKIALIASLAAIFAAAACADATGPKNDCPVNNGSQNCKPS